MTILAKCMRLEVNKRGPLVMKTLAGTSQATGAFAILAADAASDATRRFDSPVSRRQVRALNDGGPTGARCLSSAQTDAIA